jgi:AcrR family transcriptional regulator
MMADRPHVELLEKNQPRQERAKRTYEAILAAAAELLVEVGVERISTNLIAERAGITVPALYRYFPNKYSVLHALGAKLMDRQNEVADAWFQGHSGQSDPRQLLVDIYPLLKMAYEVTLEQPGGLEIIQSLRAVAPLQELRLASHRLVAERFACLLMEVMDAAAGETLALQARLSIDMGYDVVEMALEERSLPPYDILREGARMIEQYWRAILDEQSG